MRQTRKGILCVHLLNDLSGSPRVLKQVVEALSAKDEKIYLVTSYSDSGFLNHLDGLEDAYYFSYRWSPKKLVTLFRFLMAQWYILYGVWKFRKKVDVVYVNTILPFGAAIGGWLLGKRIIYHLHESEISPLLLSSFLFKVASTLSDHVIYVSAYLKHKVGFRKPSSIIYNSLDEDIAYQASITTSSGKKDSFTAIMVCSWKVYKGVHQFIYLAEMIPEMNFILVLNADEDIVKRDLRGSKLPDNLVLKFRVQDVSQLYRKSHVVVNLSFPDQWVETFGLTLLEGMAFGLPAIGPPAGGVKEVIQDGENGYWVDPYDIHQLTKKILILKRDFIVYELFSRLAKETVQKFTMKVQVEKLVHLLDELRIDSSIVRNKIQVETQQHRS